MPRFRVSIGGLAGIILVAAILMAAAKSPTEEWANSTTSLAVLILGLALTGAMFRRGVSRAYWASFAWMGWAYLFLAFGPWCDQKIAPMLFTKTVGEVMHGHFEPTVWVKPYVREIPGTDPRTRLYMYGHQQMGHSLFALLLGLMGGTLARWLTVSSEREFRSAKAIERRTPVRTPHLAVAAFVVLGLAGLIYLASVMNPTEIIANVTFSAGLLILGFAAIAAATLRGPDRAYWAGFVLIGSGYLILVYGPWFEDHVAPLLITETSLRWLEARYGPHEPMFGGVVAPQGLFAPRLIGHTLSSMILGLIGGATARWFATVRVIPNPESERRLTSGNDEV